MRRLAGLLMMLLLMPITAEAVVFDGNQVNIGLAYTEPSVNAGLTATPLTDLKRCFGDIELIGATQAPTLWSLDASTASGGVSRQVMVTIPLTASQAANVTHLRARAQCEDTTIPSNISPVAMVQKTLTFTNPPVPDTTPPGAGIGNLKGLFA